MGAKKKYFRDLYKIKDKLKDLANVPVKAYSNEVSVQKKRIIKTIIICLTIVVVIFGAFSLLNKMGSSLEGYGEVSTKERILWERENYPILDEWYEAGDFNKIKEFQEDLYSRNSSYNLNNWEHASFFYLYRECDSAKFLIDTTQNVENLSLWDIYTIIHMTLSVSYHLEERFNEDEIAKLEVYKPVLKDFLNNQLEVTDKEAEQLYKDSNNNGTLSFHKMYDYAEKVKKNLNRD